MSSQFKLEVGHMIAWEGDRCIIGAVNENCARAILPNGLTAIVPNPIRSFMREPCAKIPPCEEGCKELENLLACFADKRSELTKPISEEENETMNTKTKKSEAYKTKPRGGLAAQKAETEAKSPAKPKKAASEPKAPKAPKPAKVKVERPGSYAGISDFIGGLALAGKTNDEIKATTIAKYPGATPAWIVKVADKRKAKAAKAAAKTNAA